jgi:hypothetical protein
MSRSYASPQVPPWRVVGLLCFFFVLVVWLGVYTNPLTHLMQWMVVTLKYSLPPVNLFV